MLQTKVVEEKHTFYVQEYFCSKNRAVYEIMWKNMVQPQKQQMAI
jgi:hypothetical protein